MGDGRLALIRPKGGLLDLLIVDAFSSDAIPVHFITVEGLRVLINALSDSGTLVLHTSNRFVDLGPVIGAAGRRLGVDVFESYRHTRPHPQGDLFAISTWVAITKSKATQRRMQQMPGWKLASYANDVAPWTDSWSNLFGALLRSR